jgi:hypothetical protein
MAYPDPNIFGYRIITLGGGAPFVNRAILNFIASPGSVVDNVGTQATDVTIGSGGGGVARTVLRATGNAAISADGRLGTVFCDPGGGTPGTPVITLFQTAPQDGDEWLIVDTTRTVNGTSRKIGISAGGAPIGDPSAGGVLVSGTVYITVIGGSARFAWNATTSVANLVG